MYQLKDEPTTKEEAIQSLELARLDNIEKMKTLMKNNPGGVIQPPMMEFKKNRYDKFRNDWDVCFYAVSQNTYFIDFVSPKLQKKLRNNKELALSVLHRIDEMGVRGTSLKHTQETIMKYVSPEIKALMGQEFDKTVLEKTIAFEKLQSTLPKKQEIKKAQTIKI